MSPSGISEREYENLVREGIHAARAGNRSTARRLLFRAVSENPYDSHVWLWLSATTDDLRERRDLLEKAIAADPSNQAALAGLMHLNETESGGLSDGGAGPPPLPGESIRFKAAAADPVPAESVTFDCPQCGGRMAYDPQTRRLVCESCGHARSLSEEVAADAAETPIVGLLHTREAHAWAEAVHEVECERCGAHTIETEPGKTQICPYCGSNQLVQSEQLEGLLEPQAIAVFRIEPLDALRRARSWLNSGVFAPDGLVQEARRLQLRPAYYPFWTFDGGVEIRWTAQVRENYGRGSRQQPEWRTVSGITNEFFDDVMVSGVSALSPAEVAAIEPFSLKDVIEFEPAQLAGWPTLAYDISLSAASLDAREQVLKQLVPRVRSSVEPGKEKQDVRIGAGNWSGVTYKHVLLPIWIGTYFFDSREYHVLVNGQTGKVGGEKPRDPVKVVGIWLLLLLAVAVLTLFMTWLVDYLDLF
jgi:DNA-directed RNA polymerase subunit RPC12/RpoP